MTSLTTRKIPLRNRAGLVIAEAIVDEQDYDRVMAQGRWSLAKRGYVYRRISRNYVQTEVKLHRFLLGLTPADPMVDHIDRDPLNNVRSNLRLATNAQNAQNRGSRPGSSSRYRGVLWDSGVKKWRAQGRANGRTVYIGIFEDEDDADAAARAWRAVHMPFSVEAMVR